MAGDNAFSSLAARMVAIAARQTGQPVRRNVQGGLQLGLLLDEGMWSLTIKRKEGEADGEEITQLRRAFNVPANIRARRSGRNSVLLRWRDTAAQPAPVDAGPLPDAAGDNEPAVSSAAADSGGELIGVRRTSGPGIGVVCAMLAELRSGNRAGAANIILNHRTLDWSSYLAAEEVDELIQLAEAQLTIDPRFVEQQISSAQERRRSTGQSEEQRGLLEAA